MPDPILFSLLSRRKLRQRTTRAAALDPNALRVSMNHIESTLKKLFPKDATAIVQDVYVSYRIRDGEYILLVELIQAGERDGLYVVKIADDETRLQRELDGWMACRPDGLRHDLVLTTLEAKRDEETNRLIALIYADADQIIGVDQTLSLEQAMLDCVRFGVPTPQSIADCLFALYERLGLLLYRNSYTDDPVQSSVEITAERLDERLNENLTLWKAESAFDLRAIANTAADAAEPTDAFLPPHLFAEETLARPLELVPRLRRGYAHGDLHGRNVLVGRIGDRVLWPAVFDYGDMGTDKLIGWDFVKLETEFKIRVYPELFRTRVLPYAAEILRLEREMDIATEACRDANQWPESPEADTKLARFRWLVLMVRRHAANHLELYCGRSREWLAQYYFLLAIYGLNGIRFENLSDAQRLAGYLSAGVAAARYIYNLLPTGDAP